MGENSSISWTHHTFNPWWGCARVSRACQHCYAETMGHRFGVEWGKSSDRRFFGDTHWNEPLRWDRKAAADGVRRRVFCASMADVFEDRPDLVGHRNRLWALIADTPNLDWLLLTKRPENILGMVPLTWLGRTEASAVRLWPANVWIGTTVEDQTCADKRIPHLQAVPARIRFLSMEPLVEQVIPDLTGIAWVLVGGESGHDAVRMDPEWALDIMRQCREAGAAVHFKQTGVVLARELGLSDTNGSDPDEWPHEYWIREYPRG